jgi:radical SAM superfamily enzyme YgiQ (UPF0313 family)
MPSAAPVFQRNLDDLPLPDPGLWIPPGIDARDLWVPVQTRRGCPMDCAYCPNAVIEGRTLRRRSPERIVEWIRAMSEAGCRNFNFVDNNFNLPPSYAKGLCRAIFRAGLDIRIWCTVYPKWIDAELAELMAAAGCRQASLGFESGSDRMLRSLNKRYCAEDVGAVSELLGNAGIGRMGFLLLGGPGETRESVEESLSFADTLGLEALKITCGIRLYPGTPLARTALEEGVIRPGDDLLAPRFYMAEGLREWLQERIATYASPRKWVC